MSFILKHICCGREDGFSGVYQTWDIADAARLAYTSGPGVLDHKHPERGGHDRQAVVIDVAELESALDYQRAENERLTRERDCYRETVGSLSESANRADDGFWDAWGQVTIERNRTAAAIQERDSALADAARLRAENEAMRAVVKAVKKMPDRLLPLPGDWACRECRPESDILIDGFQCQTHALKSALAALASKNGDGE